jgi:hypothetical protein
MKPIPIITLILIANNFYLNYLIKLMAGWHFGLFHLGGIRDEYISAHSVIIAQWNWDTLGLSALTLVLIVMIWRQGLCNRWLATAISVLWLLMILMPLRSVV